MAAADAVRRAGYEDAVRLLSTALAWASPGSDRGELLCALGEAALAAGDSDRARATFAEAAELARRTGRAGLLAAAALGMAGGQGGFEINLRDPERVAVLSQALAAQPDGDSKARAALLGRLSLALAFTQTRPEQREALSTEAVAMARRLGDPAVLAVALAARCDAISGPDHVSERRAAAAEIIELTRANGDRTGELLGRRLLVVALAEAADWLAVDAEISSYARLAEGLAQPRLTWYVPLWRGARALMRGDPALAGQHARELGQLAERAGSVNARLLALVQRFVRLDSEGRAQELTSDFAEIMTLVPDDAQAGACAHALLSARRGQFAQARADLDLVVAGTIARDGDWLAKYVEVSVAAVLADHRTAAEVAYQLLQPYAGQCAVAGILAASWGSVAAHLGLLARYLGRTKEADAHFARAAELDAAAGAALAARTRDWAGGGEAPDGAAVFRLDADVWTLRYAGRTVRLRDSKGLRDLAVLLARPGERAHVGELTGAAGFPGSDVGPVADRQALKAYRERLRRIDEELAAVDAGAVEAETLNKEREALLAELSAATGLGGRLRVAGSPTERMRKAVTYRIRQAIDRVGDAHPELGRHLRTSVRTGTWCSYAPEHHVDWQR
jgi:tetratricopeptide (TPR) repeat protein